MPISYIVTYVKYLNSDLLINILKKKKKKKKKNRNGESERKIMLNERS